MTVKPPRLKHGTTHVLARFDSPGSTLCLINWHPGTSLQQRQVCARFMAELHGPLWENKERGTFARGCTQADITADDADVHFEELCMPLGDSTAWLLLVFPSQGNAAIWVGYDSVNWGQFAIAASIMALYSEGETGMFLAEQQAQAAAAEANRSRIHKPSGMPPGGRRITRV